MPNYFQISPVIFDKKIFYVFPLYTKEKLTQPSGGHVFQKIKFVLAILVESHPNSI